MGFLKYPVRRYRSNTVPGPGVAAVTVNAYLFDNDLQYSIS